MANLRITSIIVLSSSILFFSKVNAEGNGPIPLMPLVSLIKPGVGKTSYNWQTGAIVSLSAENATDVSMVVDDSLELEAQRQLISMESDQTLQDRARIEFAEILKKIGNPSPKLVGEAIDYLEAVISLNKNDKNTAKAIRLFCYTVVTRMVDKDMICEALDLLEGTIKNYLEHHKHDSDGPGIAKEIILFSALVLKDEYETLLKKRLTIQSLYEDIAEAKHLRIQKAIGFLNKLNAEKDPETNKIIKSNIDQLTICNDIYLESKKNTPMKIFYKLYKSLFFNR